MNLLPLTTRVFSSLVDGPWWLTSLSKITALLLIAWLVHFAIARIAPRWRVVLWRNVVLGLIAIVLIDAFRFAPIPPLVSLSKLATLQVDQDFTAKLDSGAKLSTAPLMPRPIPVFQATDMPLVQRSSAATIEASDKIRSEANPAYAGNWSSILCGIWIVGLGVALTRFAIGRRRLNAIVQRSMPASSQVCEHAVTIAAQMGVGHHVVLTTDEVSSPLVCRSQLGWTLLLPTSTLAAADSSDLTAILTHELAHLSGRDLPWNSFIHVVTTLLWPHPLTWPIRAAHVAACEYTADADAARRLGDPASYVRVLAQVALNASAQTQLPGLAMARISKVQSRLDRVAATFGQLPVSRRRTIAFATTALLCCALLGAFQLSYADRPILTEQEPATGETQVVDHAENPSDTKPSEIERSGKSGVAKTRSMKIKVVDLNNAAVADAVFKTVLYGRYRDELPAEFESVGDGIFNLELPQGTRILTLHVSSPGQVPMVADWGTNWGVATKIPKEFTFRLPNGTKASGKVINEAGDAIAGVKVHLQVGTNQNLRPHRPCYDDHFVTTDDDGHWVSNEMPEFLDDVWVRLAHPDYATDHTFGESIPNVPVAELRAGTHVATMVKGVNVTGTVVDQTGAPIANATIYQRRSHHPDYATDHTLGEFFSNAPVAELRAGTHVVTMVKGVNVTETVVDQTGAPIANATIYQRRSHHPKTQTDAEGKFSFDHCRQKAMVLTVNAKGLAPKLKTVAVSEISQPIVIQLKPGRTVRVRVIDTDGEPIKSALVGPDTWKVNRSLADAVINSRTNAAGLFVWQDAPADEIKYSVLAKGYMSARDVTLKVPDDVQVVTLNHPLVVEGSVTDSVTGQPIKQFQTIPGIHSESGRTSWDRRNLRNGVEGKYLFRFDSSRHGHLLQTEAPGYERAQSRVLKSDEGRLRIDFTLKPKHL